MILAIAASLVAISVRAAAAEPIESPIDAALVGAGDFEGPSDDLLEDLGGGEVDDVELDELVAQTIDELGGDEPEALGFNAEAIERGWSRLEMRPPRAMRARSPIGRVDLSLVYRRVDPVASERRDEVLLLGTWRP